MSLRHVLYVIFIWPILLLLRGVSSPFVSLGQLFRWLFYHRRSPTITDGTTPDYGDDDGHPRQMPGGRNNAGFFNQQYGSSTSGDNLKLRNRQTPSSLKLFKDEVLASNNGSPSSVGNSDPPVFYAINVPSQTLDGTECPQLVFQERVAVLKELKKYKGARFKQFSTKEEAINYTNDVLECFSTPVKNTSQNEDTAGNSPHPAILEKSNWRNPKGQDLVKLRKFIESGDYQTVQEIINSNPRFLISCGDTPSILHEGTRYNALHFAAKNNQPEIIKLYIQTIEDPGFFPKLYGQGQEDEEARNVRACKLLDLYLNTPDKTSCETPLHFACKFGHKDVVEVLMSHPLTEPNPKNKFGETPAELICRRTDKPSEQVKNDIKEYLQGRHYVPLYRNEDNIVSPVVGEPYCPNVFSPPFATSQTNPFPSEQLVSSPKSPYNSPSLVKAYAGPMSPSQADNFRKQWRSPFSKNDSAREVAIKDLEKGYERVGRDLATQNNVQWSEHWDFLGEFANLSKPEGIQLLESHLQKQNLAVNLQSSLEAIQQSKNDLLSPRSASAANRFQSIKKELFSDFDISENTKDVENFEGPSSDCGSLAEFPKPSTNQEEQMDVSPPLENGLTQSSLCDNSEQKINSSLQKDNLEKIINTLAKDFATKLIIMSPEIPSDDKPAEKATASNKKVNAKMNCLFPLKDEFNEMLSAVNKQEPLSVSFINQSINCDKPTSPCLSIVLPFTHMSPKSSTTAETVLTIRSPKKLIAQINALPAKSPPKLRNPLKVFIRGSSPTKSDLDAHRCLKNVRVDSDQFPYTTKWLKLMNSFTETERNSWPSPIKSYRNEAKSKDGTPVTKSRVAGLFEPINLFKSPN